MPFFSVIIPLFNKEDQIAETLQSVLHQSFKDFEVIVVNDGSEDRSAEIVSAFKDERIVLYTIENHGAAFARNYGIKKATSNYLALLDADDTWKNDHLISLKNLLEQFPNCGMYCKAYDLQQNGKINRANFSLKPFQQNKDWSGILKDYFEASLGNGIASSSSIVIPKTILNDVGFFNEDYSSGHDTDLWIRIALKHPVAFDTNVSTLVNCDANHRITNTLITDRKLLNLDVFEGRANKNKSLKKYLDLNRLSLAFQYKMAGNTDMSKMQLLRIHKANISSFQRALLKCPSWLLKVLLSLRNKLRQFNIHYRLFS